MPVATQVLLDGNKFALTGDNPFRHGYRSLFGPRQENEGIPGAENLSRSLWSWSLSDFTGGEGRQVFDRLADPRVPPVFWKTDGAIDTRIPGEFSMAPVTELNLGAAGVTTTRQAASGTTDVSGTTTSGTNRVFDAVNDEAKWADRTPGAVAVTVVWRFEAINHTGVAGESFTIDVKIRNDTDTVDVTSRTLVVNVGENYARTTVLSFTGTAAKSYSYHTKYHVDSETGTPSFQWDYVEEHTGAAPNDIRALAYGYADEIWAIHWDGTNSEGWKWDFANDRLVSVTGNIAASQTVALAASDKNQYALLYNGQVWSWTTGAAAQYTNAPATTTAVGMVVANNRLYLLYLGASRILVEATLDGTAVPYGATNADTYKHVATSAELPDEENAGAMPGETDAQLCRQKMCAIANGVRFFINARGGPTIIFEYSENTLKPIGELEEGLIASAIYHYGGITYIAATAMSRASAPASKRQGIWYIAADRVLRFAFGFRWEEPRPLHSYIHAFAATGSDVFILHGNNVWRYDTRSGGLTLDRTTGGHKGTRGLAVMDNKVWVGEGSVGLHASLDTYPLETVYLYGPKYDFGVDLQKVLTRFRINTKPLPSATTVALEYDLDESGTWTPAGSGTSGTRHNFSVTATGANTKKGDIVQWRVGLSSSDGVSAPTVRSVRSLAAVVDYDEFYDITINLSDEDPVNRPIGVQRTGNTKWDALKTSIENKNLVSFTPLFEDSSQNPGQMTAKTVMIEDPFGDLQKQGQGFARLRLTVV